MLTFKETVCDIFFSMKFPNPFWLIFITWNDPCPFFEVISIKLEKLLWSEVIMISTSHIAE